MRKFKCITAYNRFADVGDILTEVESDCGICDSDLYLMNDTTGSKGIVSASYFEEVADDIESIDSPEDVSNAHQPDILADMIPEHSPSDSGINGNVIAEDVQ